MTPDDRPRERILIGRITLGPRPSRRHGARNLLGTVLPVPAAAGPSGRDGRGPRARRARHALLVAVAAFLAVQAGLNLSARHDWLPIRDPVFSEKLDLLRPHPAFFAPPAAPDRPVRVLALGSSRTQLGFDAGRFARTVPGEVEAFNFGCPAAGPMTAALYFRRLLDLGVQPDVLLVEVHPGFLTPMDPPFESRWLHPYRLTPEEVRVLHDYGWPVAAPEHHGWKGWVGAAHAFRLPVLNQYAPTLVPCPFGLTVGVRSDPLGYVAGITIAPHERPRSVARTFEQYAPVFPGYHVGGPGPAALRDTLARAARCGTRAAVVLMPESTEFRGWYGPAGNEAIARFARDLSAEFAVPVFDARDWVPDDDFADGHHLTPQGGAVFTDRLAAAAAPWLVPRTPPDGRGP